VDPSANISRVTPPYLPQIIYRPRLLSLIEGNKDKKLILILGQAAQGKTTLAASYAKKSNIPCAWVNLDKQESDPFAFFQLVVQSLQHTLKGTNFSHLLSYPDQRMGPREERSLYREWAQSMFKEISIPIQIITDGLDRLSPDAPAFKFLKFLIEDSPDNIRFLLLSREIPPPVVEFQHLKVRQQALVLTNEDLAFTQEEIGEFFKKVRGISIEADQLKKIHSATEGWIGGLILFVEFLDRFQEPDRKKFVSEDFPDHFKREIFQYFGKEIFSSQPERTQEFLIKSSLIDLIEPAFIKEFTGMEDAEDVLRDHVRRNLFVQSFYDRKKGWLFKYHQLFRDFLKVKFQAVVGEEERLSLSLKAAALYEGKNDLENAIYHFLEAGAYDNAILAIERIGLNLLKTGRTGDLSRWIEALPEDLIRGNPWLIYYRCMTRRFAGTEENVLSLQKALTLFEEMGELRGLLLSLALLIETSLLRGHDVIPVAVLIERAEELLNRPEAASYPYEMALLLLQVGLGLTVRGANARKGFWACQNAYWISKKLDDTPLKVNSLVNAVQALFWLGEFTLAEGKMKELGKWVGKHPDPGVRVLYQIGRCEYSLFKGDFKEAGDLVQIAKDDAEQHGLTYLFPITMLYDLMLKPHFEQYREAEEIGAQLMNFSASIGNLFLEGVGLLLLSRNFYFEGDYEKAKNFLPRSYQILSSAEARSELHLHLIAILNGFISSHLRQNGNPERDLQNALNYFDSQSNDKSSDAHFAMALLKHGQDRDEEAFQHLEAGLRIAKKKEMYNFAMTSPRDLMQICVLALTREVKDAEEYATHLLTTRLAPLAEQELEKFTYHTDIKIRGKTREIRKAIHRSKVPRLRIETLGGLRVFRGDSHMEEAEWDRIQPKKLLEAIISYGGRSIPKEVLIDELWPEEKPGAAEKNFKTTLQRLRKCLEPSIHRDFGSSYVHLHDHLIHLDPELCEVDAEQFLSLFRIAEEKEKRGETKSALSLYAEAMELCKGDFLPEELYAECVNKKREELKRKLIELLNRMARLYEKQGAVKKAIDCHKKIIQEDPLLEEAYQKLMTLYSSKGMYGDALKVYETCKKALEAELKSKPDSTTTAIYRKVLEKAASSPPAKRESPGNRKSAKKKADRGNKKF
jgi:LuxR family maltose regulon positive regulatory protein